MQINLTDAQKQQLYDLLDFPATEFKLNFGFFPVIHLEMGFDDLESDSEKMLAYLKTLPVPQDPDAASEHLGKLANAFDNVGKSSEETHTYKRLVTLLNDAAQKAKTPEAKARFYAKAAKASIGGYRDFKRRDRDIDVLKAVTKKYPKCWQGWANLGEYYCSQVYVDVFAQSLLEGKQKSIKTPTAMKQFMEEQMKKPLTPEQIARQDKWLREGMQFFDKALALAPREAELYLQRAISRFGAHAFKDMSRYR
jgi:tetratricopeptide (TPR) repeat protein